MRATAAGFGNCTRAFSRLGAEFSMTLRQRGLAWFLGRSGPGRGGPRRHRTQYVVEGVSEFDRGRGRKGKPRRYVNDRLLALLGRIVDSFGEKARCSDGDDHCAAIERGADDLIAINLQD